MLDISHQTAAVQHVHISYYFIQMKHLLEIHYHVMLSKYFLLAWIYNIVLYIIMNL